MPVAVNAGGAFPAAPERVAVHAREDVAPATTMAVRVAGAAGLVRPVLHNVQLVASELAENLYRHAHGGELLAIPPWAGLGGSGWFAVLALDRGAGVEHFERCLVDGYTTAGTTGIGLGAARRLCDDFDAVSEPGYGTLVRAAFTVPASAAADPHFEIGAFGLPLGGQPPNGDDFAVARRGSRLTIILADGLGHGPGAAEASGAAVREFATLPDMPSASLVTEVSRRVVASRGAAIAVASLELGAARDGGHVQSAGLGNVSLLVAAPDGTSHRIATSHGTAGVRIGTRVTEHDAAFAANATLILHSDGLSTRWALDRRRELLRHAPDLVAAALWREYGHASDDCMIVVVRARPQAVAS